MAAGDLIVMDTPSSGSLAYNLVNSHAYMFESLTMVSGTPMVQLGNPWGTYQPAAIPLSQLPSVIAEVDIGQFAASNNINGTAGNDTIALAAAVTNAFIDLGAGSDMLTLADGINAATVANTETLIGGGGADTITLGTAAANASIDLACRQRHADLRQFRQLRNRRQHRDHHRRFRQRHSHSRHRADHRHLGRPRHRSQQAHPRQHRQYRRPSGTLPR